MVLELQREELTHMLDGFNFFWEKMEDMMHAINLSLEEDD